MKYYLLAFSILICLVLVTGCGTLPAPQEIQAETIETVNQVSNVVTNNIQPWLLGVIILLAGWAIPTPATMIRGFFGFIASIVGIFTGR